MLNLTPNNKRLIIVDGSSYLHRAYHALPSLVNKDGMPTGAIFGVLKMLKKLISNLHPDYFAVVFDAPGKNFRHDLYKDYKATRRQMDGDLKVQIEPLYQLIDKLGFKLILQSGVEADDVIGSMLTRFGKEPGLQIIVSTADKDFAQLVTPEINLVNTMTDQVLDPAGIVAKFGVRPDQIIDYLTLIGDNSDNVPGVPGVGAKTAVKWLTAYQSLDNLIAKQNELKGKVGKAFRHSVQQFAITRRLVTIKTDLPLTFNLADLVIQPECRSDVEQLYQKLGFKSLIFREKIVSDKKNSSNSATNLVVTRDNLASFGAELRTSEKIAVIFHTDNNHAVDAKLLGIALSYKDDLSLYLSVNEADSASFTVAEVLALLPKKALKITDELKLVYEICEKYQLKISDFWFDVKLAAYLLDSSYHRYDLPALAERYLNFAGPKDTHDCAALSTLAFKLYQILSSKFFDVDNAVVRKLYDTVELPLTKILAGMESAGIKIDVEYLQAYSQILAKKLSTLEMEAYQEAGEVFNLNSPAQLQEILFSKLKLPSIAKTSTGQASTAEESLQLLAAQGYKLPEIILSYRKLAKLKSTYTDALPLEVSQVTGRIHTHYQQTVTTTGRLSSTNPNLQNIPARTEDGRLIRKSFIAPRGFKLLSADYSQIELRVMAHLSEDPVLIRAFHNGVDIHRLVASEIFGINLDDVTESERRVAKTINFGLIYGMTAFGLAKRIGFSRAEADIYVNNYFRRFAGVKAFMDEIIALAKRQGFVSTMLGRRIYLPELQAKRPMQRQAAFRQAINAPIQGSAADIMKLAMIQAAELNEPGKITMLLQVHDELIFEVVEDKIAAVKQRLKEQMEQVIALKVPLLVTIGEGLNWDEAH